MKRSATRTLRSMASDKSEGYGEMRLQSLGLFYGVVVFMVWIDRPAAPHIISVRKGVKHEERNYWKAFQD